MNSEKLVHWHNFLYRDRLSERYHYEFETPSKLNKRASSVSNNELGLYFLTFFNVSHNEIQFPFLCMKYIHIHVIQPFTVHCLTERQSEFT